MVLAKKSIPVTHSSATSPSFEATFSYGFRPFFLGGAVYAVLVMTAWIVVVAAGVQHDWLPIFGSPFAWHAHEMIFGFAAAAIGGFLLTAVPNWTGTLPVSGWPLACLFITWLAGRVATGLSALLPCYLVVGIDLLFLPLLGAFSARQLFERPTARNLVFLVLVATLTTCNVLFHVANRGYSDGSQIAPIHAGLLVVVIMIAVIGGRIIPAFTHNWLHNNHPARHMPRRLKWVDRTALGLLVIFAVLQTAGTVPTLTAWIALAGMLANALRLALWRGGAARAQPILWVLHLGYAWIVIGLGLAALSAFTVVPSAAVTHAFGTGAIGTMILAVMTRASLGHTGRCLVASKPVVASYYLITISAALRVAAPFFSTEIYQTALVVAGLGWIGAFSIFVFEYGTILTTPRVHSKSPSKETQ